MTGNPFEVYDHGRGQEQGNKEIHKYTEKVHIFTKLTQVNFGKC